MFSLNRHNWGMKKYILRWIGCALFFTEAAAWAALGSTQSVPAQEMSYADLVHRMIDLEHLAMLPEVGEFAGQWSSWDRRSVYNAETDAYVNWDANWDDTGFIRMEGDSMVLAEMDGPGCIYRIWAARAQAGHVKIYIDGELLPAVDLPFSAYFNGQTAPFNYPQLSYDLSKGGSAGLNLYVPIPYQKSCKVVADPEWGRYVHVGFMTFAPGTKVPSFSRELAAQNADALRAVNTFFSDHLGSDPAGTRPGEQTTNKTIHVAAGARASWEFSGPAAISAIRMSMARTHVAEEMAQLRELALQITFDGQQQPAVWTPLGDFFGTAPGVNFYKSLLTGMVDGGDTVEAYAYWYMPFAASATVEVINNGDVARDLSLEIVHAPLSRAFDGMGHFHSKWHRDVFPLPADRWPDWVMLKTTGRGRYCGVTLNVWNPYPGWWGEGDEKFFVDGEKFPSIFGTGSEDYFGYAWINPTLFERPYHAQTKTENNEGHQSMLRWHVADNVPFQESFEASIEKYFSRVNEVRGAEYDSTVYWYLAPDGDDPFDPVPVARRSGYYTYPQQVEAGIPVHGVSMGFVITQPLGDGWADRDHLIWGGSGKPGSTMKLGFSVEEEGRYTVQVTLTQAENFSIVQFYVDGEKAGEPIDCYRPEYGLSDPITLGEFELAAGEHVLTVEIVGAHEKAPQGRTVFAIDQILLK